jgi:hypothetical protein
VDVAAPDPWSGKGDVDGFGLGEVGESSLFELGAARCQSFLDGALRVVDCLAKCSFLLWSERADAFEQLADSAALASEVLDLDALELV